MRNIYLNPEPEAPAPDLPVAPVGKLRLRKSSVSPAREYAMRPGEVRPIGNDLAAMILSRCGKADLSPKGITVDRADLGGRRKYGHPDHPLCNDFTTAEPRKVVYAINIHYPQVAHILSPDGRYLGTLPEVGTVAVFDADATARELAAQRRQMDRLGSHLQRLHRVDSERALAAAKHNNAEMGRIVQSLSAAESPAAGEAAEAPTANRMGKAARDHRDAAKNRAADAEAAAAAIQSGRILTRKDEPALPASRARFTAPDPVHSDRLPAFDAASDEEEEIEVINPFA